MKHFFTASPTDPVGSWAWNQGYRPGDYVTIDGQRICVLQGWQDDRLVCTGVGSNQFTTFEDRPGIFRSLPPQRSRLIGLIRKGI